MKSIILTADEFSELLVNGVVTIRRPLDCDIGELGDDIVATTDSGHAGTRITNVAVDYCYPEKKLEKYPACVLRRIVELTKIWECDAKIPYNPKSTAEYLLKQTTPVPRGFVEALRAAREAFQE